MTRIASNPVERPWKGCRIAWNDYGTLVNGIWKLVGEGNVPHNLRRPRVGRIS